MGAAKRATFASVDVSRLRDCSRCRSAISWTISELGSTVASRGSQCAGLREAFDAGLATNPAGPTAEAPATRRIVLSPNEPLGTQKIIGVDPVDGLVVDRCGTGDCRSVSRQVSFSP